MGNEWTDEELCAKLRKYGNAHYVSQACAPCLAADRIEELNGRVNYLADQLALKDQQFEEIARVLGVRGTPDAAPERMIQQIKALL